MSVQAKSVIVWPLRLLRFGLTTLSLALASFLAGSGLVYMLLGAVSLVERGSWRHFNLQTTWLGHISEPMARGLEWPIANIDFNQIVSLPVITAYPVLILAVLVIGWLSALPSAYLEKRIAGTAGPAADQAEGVREAADEQPA
jgi:hypothetical protein